MAKGKGREVETHVEEYVSHLTIIMNAVLIYSQR